MLIPISCSFPLFEKCPHNERAEAEELQEGAALLHGGEGEGEKLHVAREARRFAKEGGGHPMLHRTSCVPGVASAAQLSVLVQTGLGAIYNLQGLSSSTADPL